MSQITLIDQNQTAIEINPFVDVEEITARGYSVYGRDEDADSDREP